ncbi:trypsin-like cysteine/serine peptidase domain-containing protein [Cokeromyces recurvatus]|uniref:trypsin-like cysteine/serine peptidase domain-containing protein n=1 Tax=Cokeromyces recurvatus TaxID=90255 RepID=UPI0022200E7D|nr:trypsin-like cysteine/serine peptidase domain-containing protein [Cokeromyces recurvatus]KAI7906803.1 trypsin-like cysteine/serine peptidase domain-containing protein [Cokeromyces recurvatus]
MYICIVFIIYNYLISTAIAISGGSTVEKSRQYPFFVTLTSPTLCGGSIISLDPPWILTAAHCMERLNIEHPNECVVAYGNRHSSLQTYTTVKRAIPHPLYLSTQQQAQHQVFPTDRTNFIPYDIGLLELNEPLEASLYVNRIPIILENETRTEGHRTMGMGYTGYKEPYADVLQTTECNIINAELLKNNNFNQSVILATSNASLCHGDSGSPLIGYHENKYYLEGILNRILFAYDPEPDDSTCPFHESNSSPFINTFVKPSIHLQWILNVTQLSKNDLTIDPEASNHYDIKDSNTFISSSTSLLLKHGFLSIHSQSFIIIFLLYLLS